MKQSNCKKCGMPIRWIISKNGRWMPADYEEITTVGGETIIKEDGSVMSLCDAGEVGFISHFTTCQYADDFRTKDK